MTELQKINKQLKKLTARKFDLISKEHDAKTDNDILFTMNMNYDLKTEVEDIAGNKKVAVVVRALLHEFVAENK